MESAEAWSCVLLKPMLPTSANAFGVPWDTCKFQFLVNNAQGCPAMGKCLCGRIRPGCKTDAGRKEYKTVGGWQEHRLNQKEKLNVCVQRLDEIQSGSKDERIGSKHPCLQSKREGLKFQPFNVFSDFSPHILNLT